MQPRDYQISISDKAADIIRKHGLVYLAMQVRCGKTVTALLTAEKVQAKKVLFVTKKKVIDGILGIIKRSAYLLKLPSPTTSSCTI